MGLFRRGEPGEGEFYTGDAPVSQPGQDGQAPTVYVSGGRASPPAPEPATAPGYPPPGYPPPGYAPPGYPPPGTQPPPDFQLPPGHQHAYSTVDTSAATARSVRRFGFGCLGIVVVVVLLALGIAGFAIFRSAQSFRDTFSGPADAKREVVVGSIDVPLTFAYGDTDLRVTVTGAQSQPDAGWSYSSPDGTPNLVVSATLQQLDTGRGQLAIPFVHWHFTPADGSAPVGVNIISGFEPSIVTATLAPGVPDGGYLVFETPAISGTLTLEEAFGSGPVASWPITASTATTLTGTAGQPVRAQIGLPPFTVTLNAATRAEAGSELVRTAPGNGGYLVADLTITSVADASSGIIDAESFVFVASDGTQSYPVSSGAVTNTTSIGSVSGGASTPFVVAFDVPAGPGALQFRDDGGTVMISWPIP